MEGINKPEQKSDKGGNASQNNDNVDKRRSMAIIHPSKNHKVENSFLFWQKWLFYTSLFALFGVVFAVYGNNPIFQAL
jgi:hypothetical protein